MSALSLTYDPRSARIKGIERGYARLCHRRTIGRFALPLAFVAFVVVFLGLRIFTGKAAVGLEWLLPTVAFFAVHDLVRTHSRRQTIRERDAAPVRNRPAITLALGPEGVFVDGAKVLWSEITGVLRVTEATLLELYPYHALMIPDEVLPATVSVDALRREIDLWRQQ